MTWIKKVSSEWHPQEHPNLAVGSVIDFGGNVQRLLQEGNVVLCDEDGNEMSTFETTGQITDHERKEFEAWIEVKKQERLRTKLSAEHDELVAEAAKLKAERTEPTVDTASKEVDDKKKAWAKKMADARAKKKAERGGKSA